jgi:hypothetical protein
LATATTTIFVAMNPIVDDAHRPGTAPGEDYNGGRLVTDVATSNGEKSQLLPATTPSPAQPSRHKEEDLVTKALQFLATATPGTLGGIAVGLAAVTYFILGSIGLVLIGAFGGVVLFISYEARHPEVSRAVRGETGIEVIQRLLLESRKDKETRDEDEEEDEALLHSFEDLPPETRDALNGLVEATIRDYVKWWYSPIVPSDRSFPLSCRKVLTSFLLSVSNHLSRKRPADSFLDFLTNASSMVIVFFSELSAAFAELPVDSNMTAADAVYNYLAADTDSKLANLLNQKQQASKFKMVAEDLLGFLDRPTYDCDPARTFMREILAGVILEMTLQSCSKPEWINGWIVYLLEAGEPDFSQAIDVGMQTGPDMNNNAFADIDGNVGNIALAKPSRKSHEADNLKRKDSMAHKKKLSKADEEMEVAMEEMKRMNQMIAEEEARRVRSESATEASEKLASAVDRTSHELEAQRTTSTPGDVSPKSSLSLDKTSVQAQSGDDQSNRGEALHSPITPRSTIDSSSQNSSPKHQTSGSHSQFTSFDQIVPPATDEPETPGEPRKAQLTLHNATIIIHDDAAAEKGRMRSKPTWDYLIQIEPPSSHHAGWMIVRKYSDFETLHEILRRIANISGATAFTEQHNTLPQWKVHNRASLRGELERYIRDACWYQSLAESEGMKRFLEKDQGNIQSGKSDLSWENVGKGMLDVLTIAPKGAVAGGKAVVGGVTGVLGNIGLGQRKHTNQSLQDMQSDTKRLSTSTPPPRVNSLPSPKPRDSLDSQRSSVISSQPGKIAPMERRPSYNSQGDGEDDNLRASRSDRWEPPLPSARASREHSRASSLAPLRSPSSTSLNGVRLPPPPDEMPDDYDSPVASDMQSKIAESVFSQQNSFNSNTSYSSTTRSQMQGLSQNRKGPTISNGTAKPSRQFSQLSEQETGMAVELLFAVINELYTLSSAWNIRRTLLAAAKSFLLRPGNPSLVSIQSMIQKSVLEANTSDAGIAAHLRKIRENSMPTDQERAAWPAEMTQEEKDRLRIKARKLLIQSGVPAALMGVMGQSATSDAMGRVFDCLQIEEVARGLIFGLMLQAVKVITH